MNKTKKPRIRFKGFTDDWEQRKLGDIATFINGRAYSQTELLDEGKYRVLRVGNFYTNDSWYYSNIELPERYYANDGDLLYTWSATFGPHIWHGEKVIYHYHIWKIELANTGKKHFMVQLLDRDKEALLAGHNGSTMIHITKSGMEQKHVMIPVDATEQDKIGVFFTYLDKTITLHQRKCEKLKIIKKSMIENCFPKNGQKVPKIRFSGFTGDWEQRKVGEFLTVSKIPGHTGIDAKKLTVKLWGKGIIGKNDVFTGSENTKYYIRRAGQFMYGKLDFLHAAFGIVPEHLDTYESTLDSPAFDMHDIDSHFLLERVMQKNFYLHNGIIANGSRKAKRIHENIFLDMDLVVPSYIEQEKIGSIFRSLDDLITLHQRKLEKLKKIKKSMLERMFV